MEVLDSHNCSSVPVDLLGITKGESRIKLELLPQTSSRFGRIEYYPRPGYFAIFCSESISYDSVARFSLGHELGHYFLEAHREHLYKGDFHCSKSGFICESGTEREADEFSARLMIPAMYMKQLIQKKPKLALNDLKNVANDCQTSLTCAAFRYVECDIEPCAIIVSEDKKVKFYRASKTAENKGFKWLGQKSIPEKSPTMQAFIPENKTKICSSGGITTEWFSRRPQEASLFEEAFALGNTGLVLTMLYFEFEEKDDYFLPSERYYR
jgi:hypothetical protein